ARALGRTRRRDVKARSLGCAGPEDARLSTSQEASSTSPRARGTNEPSGHRLPEAPRAAGLCGLARVRPKFACLGPTRSLVLQPRRCLLSSPSSCSHLIMESPVHIFRGEPAPTFAPSTCLSPNDSSSFPGTAEPDINNSAVSDAPPEPAHISPAIPVIITAVYSVVFVVGLVGNSLVMFVIIRYTKMKTATNIYIFNLALADALVTTTMPFQSTVYLMNSWPFGDVLCKIVISIDYYNMFTSIFTLTMMSVDRYIAVCHPVKALDFRTPLKAKIINICIWLLSSSVGISAIVLGGTKVREDMDVIECSLQFPDDDYSWWDLFMKICVFIFAFVIPVLIIIVCYTLMILRLKSVRLLSGSREKDRNLRRITRLVLVVVAVFIICWTPIHIFILVEALGSTSHSTAALSSYYFCIALGYTNSSLNPILYAFLDENFKRCFRDFCFPIKMRMERQSTSRVRNTVQDPAYMRDVDGINKPV
ncbi:Kappa-type opioid receptor, partial [Galemys pyrenaicus]